jgi:hypothetical protein
MRDPDYAWSEDDRPPPDEDAEAAADLHGFLEHMTVHYSIHHAGRVLTPRQEFSGILAYAAYAIDRLAQHEAAGDAEDHLGSLLSALGGFYQLLVHYASGPLPWPDQPPGAEEDR